MKHPGFGFVAHRDELAENAVAESVDLAGFDHRGVAALDGVFKPGLGFGGFSFGLVQLVDEDGFVFAPTPCFGELRRNGAGRAAHLIRERISLLLWK